MLTGMDQGPALLTARPNLEAKDVPALAAWLEETLGFTTEVVMGDPVTFAIVRCDGAALALAASDSPAIPSVPACYIEVTGVDRLHEQCLLSGAEVTPPSDRPWGLRDFVVEAPSGHLLAVGERIGAPVTV
jgi:uncharacterized glyoxalase superfamily protein PhnB